MKRASGILMHISSLSSPYGIGTLGRSAYEFVDFLERSGQKYWQVLALNPTSFGDSPYQSPSAFAGNHNFIDFDILKDQGLLKVHDYEQLSFSESKDRVDYGKIFDLKIDILKIAFQNIDYKYVQNLKQFKEENKYWLDDYALYMAIKYNNDLKPWYEWEDAIKFRKKETLINYKKRLNKSVDFWIFTQYIFYKQWEKLKNYANKKNISIIGDIPIYVAEDSSDLWAKGEIFLLDEENRPISVAGVPPDDFSDSGQYWGNPLYNWDYLKQREYRWWIERIQQSLKLYDMIRLDHFRGFESYWSIATGARTAREGEWKQGPGIDLFNMLEEKLGEIPIIIEDLGQVTDGLVALRKAVKYPSMKVLQFAFSSDESNEHLPHNYEKNHIVYTGTHDNNTLSGWINTVDTKTLEYTEEYLSLDREEGYIWGMIRGAWASVANISIAQMQDFLELGQESRMNTPNTEGCNWEWRIEDQMLSDELANRIKKLTKTYDR